MRRSERKAQIRTMSGEATTVALLWGGGLAMLLLAAPAKAQQQPLMLPATHVTVPQRTFSPGEGAKVKGLIISRNGDDMVIRDETGYLDVVTLTADTKISSPSGIFKTEKKHRDVTSLLPGLIVEVKGSGGSNGNIVADKVSFHSSALKVAQQIAAGDVVQNERIQANKDSIVSLKRQTQNGLSAVNNKMLDSISAVTARARDSLGAINARFDDIDKYTERDSAHVNFATGKAELNDEAKRALDDFAARGMSTEGYLIEVRGYADSVGTPSYNMQLSERRAQAVVDYLALRANVPLRRMLNPTGFGEMDPAAPNSTSEGRAVNRRADLKLLVNRAIR